METRDLLQRLKTIPISTDKLAEHLLSGNFNSVFKGQGIEFDEIRHYQCGDDIRSIDWNASARFSVPFVKMYREERDLTILILLDISASMDRESRNQRLTPFEQGVLASAIISFSAEQKSQRTGALLFDDGVYKVFLPARGRPHLLSLFGSALRYRNQGQADVLRNKNAGSNIGAALAGAARLLKRRSLIVLVSDFFSIGWEDQLSRLCRKHDVIALRVSDPDDMELPALGLIQMEDPETGLRITASSMFKSFHNDWKEWHEQRAQYCAKICTGAGAVYLELPVTADAARELYRLFSRNY